MSAVFLLVVSSASKAGVPSILSNAKSEAECFDWGRSYQGAFDSIIATSRSADDRCSKSFKGKYETVQGFCPNTTGGPVEYQNPCDEATKWTKCLWIGFQRGMQVCLAGISKVLKKEKPDAADDKQEVTLDEADIAFLKEIAKKDEFVRKLAASSAGEDILGRVLGYVVTGPAKLALQWDQALISGWKRANASLENLNKSEVCGMTTEHSLETKSFNYFDSLYKIRGCDGH